MGQKNCPWWTPGRAYFTRFWTPSVGRPLSRALNATLFLTIVSSRSCQKSLHKYFGSPNIDFFWNWIYFYWSHFVAINISNSHFLIQGMIFLTHGSWVFLSVFSTQMRNTNFAHEFKFDNLKYYSQQSETNKNKSNAKRSQYLLNPIICEVIFDMTSIIW